ncbi:MAG: hypothetical protein ACRD1S_07520, partial [Vicinamibacterales bacterium]
MPAVLPALAIVLGAAAGSVYPSRSWIALVLVAAGAACLTLRRPGAGFSIAVIAGFGAAGAALAGGAA